MLDVENIKKDFPIFSKYPGLSYLDSAATSLKPKPVIAKINEYYERYSANIHRGIYNLSEIATQEYELARKKIATFINAPSANNIIFTRGTTESVNLIVYAYARQIINEGDEIVTTIMEHHSNFVPWQALAAENGAILKIINCTDEGELDLGKKMESLNTIITKRTKILTLTAVSNVLGTINPIRSIIAAVRSINPKTVIVIDAAQAIQAIPVDVNELDCDFLAFSGHKILGPTGIGVLYGKANILQQMAPFQYGGDMIRSVTIEETEFNEVPSKFEAGTPNIAGAIGLGAAIDYVNKLGIKNILEHENNLIDYAIGAMTDEFGDKVNIIGSKLASNRVGLISFDIKNIHPHDIAQILNDYDVAVRAGHHCAMPLHTSIDMVASTRASFYVYTSKSDVDKLITGIKKAVKLFMKV